MRSVSNLADLLLLGVEDLVELLLIDIQGDLAEELDEPAVSVIGEALVAGPLGRPFRVCWLRPRLRMVSIMPGMERAAPDRTETRRGFFGSPKPFPAFFSTAFICTFISSIRPGGKARLLS